MTAPPGRPREAASRGGPAAAYALLLILGVLEGLVGSFQYSRGIGHVPVAAMGFALLIGLTGGLCGWAMRATGAAVAPAVGWLLAVFVLGMPRPSGSVVITNTFAGQVYLYGGALSAAIGVGFGISAWTRRVTAGRPGAAAAPGRRVSP